MYVGIISNILFKGASDHIIIIYPLKYQIFFYAHSSSKLDRFNFFLNFFFRIM